MDAAATVASAVIAACPFLSFACDEKVWLSNASTRSAQAKRFLIVGTTIVRVNE